MKWPKDSNRKYLAIEFFLVIEQMHRHADIEDRPGKHRPRVYARMRLALQGYEIAKKLHRGKAETFFLDYHWSGWQYLRSLGWKG